MSHLTYENPLISRYASQEMSQIWSAQKKHSTWRRLWVALAESQHEMGLPVTAAQVESLRSAIDDIDFEVAAREEKKRRHDVMAHVHTYGERCPDAQAIIHLGATSCFVTDNSELIMIRESLEQVRKRLVSVIDQLAKFAAEYRDLPCLGFTHLQPAQPTTIGKRAT
ncbi:MAG: adenylosuccinate lyase, partial [Planctomycetaceae bacterium]|nr:adenylosuccinate lyase [Planctomycetaceae bacterium]